MKKESMHVTSDCSSSPKIKPHLFSFPKLLRYYRVNRQWHDTFLSWWNLHYEKNRGRRITNVEKWLHRRRGWRASENGSCQASWRGSERASEGPHCLSTLSHAVDTSRAKQEIWDGILIALTEDHFHPSKWQGMREHLGKYITPSSLSVNLQRGRIKPQNCPKHLLLKITAQRNE